MNRCIRLVIVLTVLIAMGWGLLPHAFCASDPDASLNEIVLKKDPSDRDTRKYVEKLLKEVHGRNALDWPNTGAPSARNPFGAGKNAERVFDRRHYSTNSSSQLEIDDYRALISQVEKKLDAVSSQQIPVILEVCLKFVSLRSPRVMRSYFAFADPVVAVISKRTDIDSAGKKAILDSLISMPYFIKIVDTQGWGSDLENADVLVRSDYFKELAKDVGLVEIMPIWVRLLSANSGKRSTEALLFALLKAETSMRNAAFNAWPGEEIGGLSRHQILMMSWRKSFGEIEYSPCILAKAVAESGEKEAIIYIAKIIVSKWVRNTPARKRFQEIARKELMELCRVSEADVVATAESIIKNSDRLVFDPTAKSYSW